MALFRWRESLCLGIADIDDDHKRLIGLLNRLHFMVLAGDEASAVGDVLAELVTQTARHFRREEALMLRIGYPHLAAHRGAHEAFCKQLAGHHAAFRDNPPAFAAGPFYDFLADWLIVHMLSEDLRLKPYVAAAAAATAAA